MSNKYVENTKNIIQEVFLWFVMWLEK